MTNVTFTGDPRAPGADPALSEMYGITFPFNKPVEVEDAGVVAKLRRHNHFTVDGVPTKGESLAKARETKAQKAKARAAS